MKTYLSQSIVVLVILISFLLVSSCKNGVEPEVSKQVKQPNILFILLDDLGKEWISAYGATDIQTPAIDKLAQGGMQFNNAYSHPQCTPSRVALMTGQYPFRNGWVNHWDTPRWGQAYFDWSKYPSMARTLKSVGYKTAAAGKWQINDFRLEPEAMVKHGFDEYAMWTGFEEGVPASEKRYWDPYIHTKSGSKTYQGKFGEDIFSDFLIDFMVKNKGAPWFVYYPMALPHGPLVPTPAEPSVTSKMDKHKAMVRYADFILDKLVKALEASGQRDNTIIVWTTDNGTSKNIVGTMDARKVRGGKTLTTENGINAPFIVNAPGLVPQGIVSDALLDFTDLLPTFAQLAGASLPTNHPIDGVSFADLITGKTNDSARDWIMAMGGQNRAKVSIKGVENEYVYRDRVLRDKRYKVFLRASPERGLEKMVDLADFREEADISQEDNAVIQKSKQRLLDAARQFPDKDADPSYRQRQTLDWDKPITVESGVWKK